MRARSIVLMAVTWLLTLHADADDTRRVLTNHIGYQADGPKRAVVQMALLVTGIAAWLTRRRITLKI